MPNSSINVLLVEDNKDTLRYLTLILQQRDQAAAISSNSTS